MLEKQLLVLPEKSLFPSGRDELQEGLCTRIGHLHFQLIPTATPQLGNHDFGAEPVAQCKSASLPVKPAQLRRATAPEVLWQGKTHLSRQNHLHGTVCMEELSFSAPSPFSVRSQPFQHQKCGDFTCQALFLSSRQLP